jgi:hypothetical protein
MVHQVLKRPQQSSLCLPIDRSYPDGLFRARCPNGF